MAGGYDFGVSHEGGISGRVLGYGWARVENTSAGSAWRRAPVVASLSVVGPGVVKAGQGVVVCIGADEGIAAARDAVSDEVPDEGADACVKGVLQKHVAHILLAHGAGLEGCKAALHDEDKAGREQDVEGVGLLHGLGQRGGSSGIAIGVGVDSRLQGDDG